MSKRSIEVLLEDILAAVAKIERYTQGMDKDAFLSDDKTQDAVIRNLEIIGEVVAQLPEAFKAKAKHIPWHPIIGLRNRVVHATLE